MPETFTWSSPVGSLAIEIEENCVVCVSIDNLPRNASSNNPSPFAKVVIGQLEAYFTGGRTQFDLSINPQMISDFQSKVLEIVRLIPYGKTLTYGQIACRLGKPQASRAVGAALARNPLPILIPCHRVIAMDGRLMGYLGRKGIAAKKWLLELEGHKIVSEKLV
jgi:methylated-DNA-[protein]-cysteine S-methyltransferase